MKKVIFIGVLVSLLVIIGIANAANFCPNCGESVSPNANFCPSCGQSLAPNANFTQQVNTQTNTLESLPYLSCIGNGKIQNNGNLPVYTGPGAHYYRSASGKAAIASNQRVEVYGRDGSYLLVRYFTTLNDKDISRYAYAPVDKVSNGYSYASLSWGSVPITISGGAVIVDEPDGSRTGYNTIDINHNSAVALALINSPKGGVWVYFESTGYSQVNSQGNIPVRGFVSINSVSVSGSSSASYQSAASTNTTVQVTAKATKTATPAPAKTTYYRYQDTTTVEEWSSWSSWQKDAVSASSTVQVEKGTQYHYWAAQCKNCGTTRLDWGSNIKCRGCGKTMPRENMNSLNKYFVNDGSTSNRVIDGITYKFADSLMVYRYRTMTTKTVTSGWSAWSTQRPQEKSGRTIQTKQE